MSDLVWRSIGELARLVLTKEVSPVEVVRATSSASPPLDATLRAFITVCADAGAGGGAGRRGGA